MNSEEEELQPMAAETAMSSHSLSPADYGALLAAVRERIRTAQYEALRSANRELVGLYWDIGRMVAERQRDEAWGGSVVKQLAADLREQLPGVGGFPASNLWRMRVFYLAYRQNAKLAPLVREIGWSHGSSSWSAARTISSASSTSA